MVRDNRDIKYINLAQTYLQVTKQKTACTVVLSFPRSIKLGDSELQLHIHKGRSEIGVISESRMLIKND